MSNTTIDLIATIKKTLDDPFYHFLSPDARDNLEKLLEELAPTFRPLGTNGDHMTMADFMSSCECNAFIDYDGYGDLATDKQVSNITVTPSAAKHWKKLPTWATHVVWYNR